MWEMRNAVMWLALLHYVRNAVMWLVMCSCDCFVT